MVYYYIYIRISTIHVSVLSFFFTVAAANSNANSNCRVSTNANYNQLVTKFTITHHWLLTFLSSGYKIDIASNLLACDYQFY